MVSVDTEGVFCVIVSSSNTVQCAKEFNKAQGYCVSRKVPRSPLVVNDHSTGRENIMPGLVEGLVAAVYWAHEESFKDVLKHAGDFLIASVSAAGPV